MDKANFNSSTGLALAGKAVADMYMDYGSWVGVEMLRGVRLLEELEERTDLLASFRDQADRVESLERSTNELPDAFR